MNRSRIRQCLAKQLRKSSLVCTVILTLLATPLHGQSSNLAGIAHVAFRVSNIEETREFYQRLGFEQAFALNRDGAVSQSFIKINNQQFIELYPTSTNNAVVGFMHLCFQSDNIEALHAQYLKNGLSPTRVRKAGAGNLLFTLEGPEHQNIEYTQYLPGSLHQSDSGRHLGADRISTQMQSVTLLMASPPAAKVFYIDKLSFHLLRLNREQQLVLPGSSGESVRLIEKGKAGAPDITFTVVSLKQTIKTLKARGFVVRKDHTGIYVLDPDHIAIGFSAMTPTS